MAKSQKNGASPGPNKSFTHNKAEQSIKGQYSPNIRRAQTEQVGFPPKHKMACRSLHGKPARLQTIYFSDPAAQIIKGR